MSIGLGRQTVTVNRLAKARYTPLSNNLEASTYSNVRCKDFKTPSADVFIHEIMHGMIRLLALYSVIKGADEHIKFVFLTGVSKFSKVSIFSGLNNLKDITLDKRYSVICGYTERDLDTVFAPELAGLDRDEIRRWYNGYN